MADTYWDNVALLLHANGANGSTSLTDSSNYGHTVTCYNSAQLTTSQKKFGSASIQMGVGTSTVGRVGTPTSALFTIGNYSAYTVEFWVRFTSLAGSAQAEYQTLFEAWEVEVAYALTGSDKQLYINGSSAAQSAALSLSTGTWYHIAYVRNGSGASTTHKLFLDGVEVISAGNILTLTTTARQMNFSSTAAGLLGQMDEIRVTPGVARYTANFTAPTDEFPTSYSATALGPVANFGTPTREATSSNDATALGPVANFGPNGYVEVDEEFFATPASQAATTFGSPQAEYPQFADATALGPLSTFGADATSQISFRASAISPVALFGTPTTPTARELDAEGFATAVFSEDHVAIQLAPEGDGNICGARGFRGTEFGASAADAPATCDATGLGPAANLGEPEHEPGWTLDAAGVDAAAVFGVPALDMLQEADGFAAPAFGAPTAETIHAAQSLGPVARFGDPDEYGPHRAYGFLTTRMGRPTASQAFGFDASGWLATQFDEAEAVQAHLAPMLPPGTRLGTPTVERLAQC